LLEHPCAVAWNQVFSAVTTPTPWLRAQLPTGSKWSLISKALVTLASPTPCAPSASQSFPQFWLHPDRQFAHAAQQRHTNLSNNIALYLRELTSFLLSGKSVACVIVDVQMLSTGRPRSHEQLAEPLECLRTNPRNNNELCFRELLTFLWSGTPAARAVTDTEVRFTLWHGWLPIVVPRVDTEAATTAPEMLTLCPWLSLDGLPWFVRLILESSSPGLVPEVGAQTHLRALSRTPIWQYGELEHSSSVHHRSNRTVATLDKNKSSEVQQHAAQSFGVQNEINR
jgi:hypothetical protein